jgi:hypothetical protein
MSVKRPTNHIINEFRILYETRQFITMFTTARYGTLLYVR